MEINKVFRVYFYKIPKKINEILDDVNKSNNYSFYSRERYLDEDFDDNYMHLILNFGYLIQFGSASPILLIMVSIQVYCERLANSILFSQTRYFDTISKMYYNLKMDRRELGYFQT